jgi:hypothetical protein
MLAEGAEKVFSALIWRNPCRASTPFDPPLLGDRKEGELRDTLKLPAGENLLHLSAFPIILQKWETKEG